MDLIIYPIFHVIITFQPVFGGHIPPLAHARVAHFFVDPAQSSSWHIECYP